jgi:hypothetical protein
LTVQIQGSLRPKRNERGIKRNLETKRTSYNGNVSPGPFERHKRADDRYLTAAFIGRGSLRDRASDQIHSCSTRTSSPFFSRASARANSDYAFVLLLFPLRASCNFCVEQMGKNRMESRDDKEKKSGRSSAAKNGSNYVTRDARASNSSGARSYARRLLAGVSPYARSRALTRRISRIPYELHACVRACVCVYIVLRVPSRGETAACWLISALNQAVADNSLNTDAHSVIRIRTHS